MTADKILDSVGIGSRAAYYSGNGATLSDLRPEHLYKIHTMVLEHHGEKAASGFVKMVAEMKQLSATSFINEFKYLGRMNWEYKCLLGASSVDIDGEGSAFGTLASMMFGGNRSDDTEAIREQFLFTYAGIVPKNNGSRYEHRRKY